MRAKKKLIISMLVVSFVLLSIIATVAIAFALTQQTIKTTLNIGYTVEDIDGKVTASYAMNEDAEAPLTAMQGETVLGDELVFKATDTEETEARYFLFPDITFTSPNDYITIRYTYSNTGDKHYIASMSFDAIVNNENMKIEYGIWDSVNEEIKYSEDRYALVIPTDKELSYWIRISIENKSKNASLSCEIDWLLEACNPSELGYQAITALEFTGSDGAYTASYNGDTSLLKDSALIVPSMVNGSPVTAIAASSTATEEQKAAVTSVYIPESVETIGDNAFEGYTNLETVTLEQNEAASGASVQSDSTGLTTIGANSFKDCSSLTELTIPNTVTKMDTTALTGCSNLKNITLDTMNSNVLTAVKTLANTNGEMNLVIGDSVTTIETRAFEDCTGLTSVTIGSGVTSIGSYAFYECIGLTSIVIPNSVTSIGNNTFYGCTGLTNIEIPDSVTSIGNFAFNRCSGLTSIVIPNSVTSIGENGVFGNCSSLTSITVASGNTSYHIENNCLIETSTNTLIRCYANIIEIEIPSSVTSIGHSAFSGCKNLTSIEIPNSVTSIGAYAFQDCTGLTSATIGFNVTYIGFFSFSNCANLQNVTDENSTSWKVENILTSSSSKYNYVTLYNNSNAATYLTSTYCDWCIWTR